MKILIVDDNEAIQEILSEILSVDGYKTVTASSVDAAVVEIEASVPDAILLESTVNGTDGLELIDRMLKKGHLLSNVILLTTGNEQIPKDTPSVVGSIQKPFKSTEVLDKLRDIFADTVKKKPKISVFKALFGKKVQAQGQVSAIFGRSYLFIEDEADHAYEVASRFSDQGYDVMVLSSGRIKAARERFGNNNVKVIGLSGKDGPCYIEPGMLGSLMGAMNDFITENERPVLMLDDLDILIDRNDLNSILTMIHQVVNGDHGKPFTLIASARSGEMTEKDRELLEHSMEIHLFGE